MSAVRESRLMTLNIGPQHPSTHGVLRLVVELDGETVVKLVPDGYDVRLDPHWDGFPTKDVEADTALMNLRLQDYVDEMRSQYYWVNKRFKTRPPGEPPVY